MRFVPAALLSFSLLLPATSAFAWGGPGHMEVAAVAWSKMTPAARAKSWELLQRHKYFSKWTDILGPYASKPDRERYYFILAATWADNIRGDDDFAADDKPASATPVWPGFPDMWKHTDWHYIDASIVLYPKIAGPETQVSPPNDVEAAIPMLETSLKNAANPDAQAFALPWLEHLVGDIHQPLHCASRYSKFDLNDKGEAVSDQGGNKMKVLLNGKETKLHTLWDDIVGKPAVISFKPYKEDYVKDMETVESTLPVILKDLSNKQVKAWAKDDAVGRWRLESTRYAEENIYAVVGFDVPGQPFPEVSPEQYSQWQEYGYKRVAAAGWRLAKVINTGLDGSATTSQAK